MPPVKKPIAAGDVEPTPAEDAPAAPPAKTRAIEAWAEEIGYLPQFLGGNSLGGVNGNPAYWKYAAAKALMVARKKWEDGQQVTRAEFEAAFVEYDALRFG